MLNELLPPWVLYSRPTKSCQYFSGSWLVPQQHIATIITGWWFENVSDTYIYNLYIYTFVYCVFFHYLCGMPQKVAFSMSSLVVSVSALVHGNGAMIVSLRQPGFFTNYLIVFVCLFVASLYIQILFNSLSIQHYWYLSDLYFGPPTT